MESLEDKVSPNEIDDEEGNWLASKIEGDGHWMREVSALSHY